MKKVSKSSKNARVQPAKELHPELHPSLQPEDAATAAVRKAVGERLASVRTDRGRNQQEFAADLGVTPLTLGRYERGERLVTADFALALAGRVGVSPTWLLLGVGAPRLEAANLGALPAGYVTIPKLDVNAAAGAGFLNDSESVTGYYVCDESMLRREFGIGSADCRIIKAFGDSMAPDILSGDELLVDVSVQRFAGDAIYVIRTDDGLQVKRLQRRTSAILQVVSANPAYATTIATVGGGGFAICGRVVGKLGYVRF